MNKAHNLITIDQALLIVDINHLSMIELYSTLRFRTINHDHHIQQVALMKSFILFIRNAT